MLLVSCHGLITLATNPCLRASHNCFSSHLTLGQHHTDVLHTIPFAMYVLDAATPGRPASFLPLCSSSGVRSSGLLPCLALVAVRDGVLRAPLVALHRVVCWLVLGFLDCVRLGPSDAAAEAAGVRVTFAKGRLLDVALLGAPVRLSANGLVLLVLPPPAPPPPCFDCTSPKWPSIFSTSASTRAAARRSLSALYLVLHTHHVAPRMARTPTPPTTTAMITIIFVLLSFLQSLPVQSLAGEGGGLPAGLGGGTGAGGGLGGAGR